MPWSSMVHLSATKDCREEGQDRFRAHLAISDLIVALFWPALGSPESDPEKGGGFTPVSCA